MTSPTQIANTDLPKKRYKMALKQDEFMVTPGGSQRYPAGAVLLADEETALRWYETGVAELADPDADTYGEVQRRVKKEEFFKRAQAVEGTFDAVVTRGHSAREGERQQLMPPPMPVPKRGPGRARRDLEGAGVINDISGDEEE